MITLHPYQQEVFQAIKNSVVNRKGLTFSVEIARQGGKNELSAQLEVGLLTYFMREARNLIKSFIFGLVTEVLCPNDKPAFDISSRLNPKSTFLFSNIIEFF